MEDTFVNQGFLILHSLFSPLSPPFPPQKIKISLSYIQEFYPLITMSKELMAIYLQGRVKLWVLSFMRLNSTKTFSTGPLHCLIPTESMLNRSTAVLVCTPTSAPQYLCVLCKVFSKKQNKEEITPEMGQDTKPRETTTLNKPERDLTTGDFFQPQYPHEMIIK